MKKVLFAVSIVAGVLYLAWPPERQRVARLFALQQIAELEGYRLAMAAVYGTDDAYAAAQERYDAAYAELIQEASR